jgi:hypothetical protein
VGWVLYVWWIITLGLSVVILVIVELFNKRPPKLEGSQPKSVATARATSETIIPPTIVQTRLSSGTKRTSPRWLASGERISIAGFTIPGGLIYVGSAREAPHWADDEKSVIDPTLPVARARPDRAGTTMTYWPAYARITPEARLAYLEWLAGGRTDPAISIGHVFLFFYGLERRLMLDRTAEERAVIVAEVERLRSLYGANASYDSYSAALLQAVAVDAGTVPEPTLTLDRRREYELPLDVRIHLGRLVAARTPLSPRDALVWLLASPETSLRTPARRCFGAFTALWSERFAARYPNGLRIAQPKTRLKAHYRAASGGFVVDLAIGDLPDVAALSAPVKGFAALADECSEDLAAYSRLLGKRPEAGGSIEAAALLPREIWHIPEGAPMMDAKRALADLVAEERIVTMRLRELCGTLGLDAPTGERVPVATERSISAILDHLDVGFEPDRRYGTTGLSPNGVVVLFQAEGGARVDADAPEYSAARILVEIAALAATSDDHVAPAEIESIQADLRSFEGLTPISRRRLLALMASLLGDAPKLVGAVNRLAKLDQAVRQQVTQAAINAVLADGFVRPAEVRFLERLHKALALPIETLYTTIHQAAVAQDEPQPITAGEETPGVAIPAEVETPAPTIRIDPVALARKLAETAESKRLLAGVFVDEAEPAPSRMAPAISSRFPGLDDAHAALLGEVLAARSFTPEQFEDRARALGLMAGGALEAINDWGFECFDEAVLDDGEAIFIPDHLRTGLSTMGAPA